MDKIQLQKIFSTSFKQESWIEVLKSVFGVKQLLTIPRQISIPTNDIANEAFELGNFTTSDDRIIGLYKVNVKSNVWLERNKVGLRTLLRDVYRYDVDGALIVFVQDEKWRLSFVSEVKVLNDEGEVVTEITEPKRYTYILGQGEKVQTPSIFISKLSGKIFSLEDIRKSFSVDVLNEEFYKVIQQKFYELVGGKIGANKKTTDFGEGKLKLPGILKEARQIHQEFGVRLIGRTVFCWFLKMKKADNVAPLISEELLSSNAVKKNNEYYHSVLERLFFQTLNTPMDERIEDLPEGCEKVPFLNGGLFEPGIDDYYRFNKITGLSENINTLKISNDWFLSFFEELEKYNFTIDENSVTDVEVSVDPEMLGRIFENLLAEIDPDSGETARKATGSFYTPREIVDYMATESLVQYIHNKTSIEQDKLRPIFKMTESTEVNFEDQERIKILQALDSVKILDPACGSGAFPMGVLQKIVAALQKLDKNAEWWIKQRINENKNATARKAVKEKLEGNSQYARKIGIIQNTLYGVDIQPIAAEISKLRCFLTLVVDERIDDSKLNRGIDPLPNLEFKFVTADTLIKLPEQTEQRGFFDHFEELEELEQLRIDYLQSSGKEKQKIKERFPIIQNKIFKEQLNLFVDIESRAYKLSSWNPFGHDKADWFDAKWMYGIDGFDIVIGNPPYVQMQKEKGTLAARYQKFNYETFERTGDIYSLFYEQGYNLLKTNGVLTYITSNKWMRAGYGTSLRSFFSKKTNPVWLIDFGQTMVFKSAIVHSNIILIEKKTNENKVETVQFQDDLYKNNINISTYFKRYKTVQIDFNEEIWNVSDSNDLLIKKMIEKNGTVLGKMNLDFNRGLLTGLNEAFIITDEQVYINLINQDSKNIDLLKPVLRGRDTRRYFANFNKVWIVNSHNGIKDKKIERIDLQKDYHSIYNYLLQFEEKGKMRLDKGDHWTNLRNCAYIDQFEKPKIIFSEIVSEPQFYLDTEGFYPEATVFFISGENLKYLLGILNSKPATYIFKKFYAGGELLGKYRYKKSFLMNLPIPKVNEEERIKVEILVDYLTYLYNVVNIPLIGHTSNQRIGKTIDEVLDMLIYEFYLREYVEDKDLNVSQFLKPIQLQKSHESEIILNFYLWIQEPNNPIRNRIIAANIKSQNIIGKMNLAY